jgi:hypothetical protein
METTRSGIATPVGLIAEAPPDFATRIAAIPARVERLANTWRFTWHLLPIGYHYSFVISLLERGFQPPTNEPALDEHTENIHYTGQQFEQLLNITPALCLRLMTYGGYRLAKFDTLNELIDVGGIEEELAIRLWPYYPASGRAFRYPHSCFQTIPEQIVYMALARWQPDSDLAFIRGGELYIAIPALIELDFVAEKIPMYTEASRHPRFLGRWRNSAREPQVNYYRYPADAFILPKEMPRR